MIRNLQEEYTFITYSIKYDSKFIHAILVNLYIQNIILKFTNIMFIKFYFGANDKEYELRSFDTNLSFRVISKIFEKEKSRLHHEPTFFDNICANGVRIWLRKKIRISKT